MANEAASAFEKLHKDLTDKQCFTSLAFNRTGRARNRGETGAVRPETIPFRTIVREIVKDEIRAAMATAPTQQLGTVDEFDIESAVKKYDNALPVLRDWYAHENVAVELPQTLSFRGLGKHDSRTKSSRDQRS
jgi:hypothetical protein